MKHLAINAENISEAVKVLKAGGVIAHPADTCFGLAADFKNPEAIEKVRKIKGRDSKNPMSIMLPAYMKGQIDRFAKMDDFAREVCEKMLPGPVTVLLPKRDDFSKDYYPETPRIGIRIPYDTITQDILTAFKGPLVTTSANLSGTPACRTSEEAVASLRTSGAQPDLMIEGAIKGECKPSTIIYVLDGTVEIVREGPMSKQEIEGILGVTVREKNPGSCI